MSFVYAAYGASGLVKIGTSSDPLGRMANLGATGTLRGGAKALWAVELRRKLRART